MKLTLQPQRRQLQRFLFLDYVRLGVDGGQYNFNISTTTRLGGVDHVVLTFLVQQD